MLPSDDPRPRPGPQAARSGVRLRERVGRRHTRSADWADLVAQAADRFARDARGPLHAYRATGTAGRAVLHSARFHPGRPECLPGPGTTSGPDALARLSTGWLDECRERLCHTDTTDLMPLVARDRALISAIRRRPILVAAVAADRPLAVRRPGTSISGQTVIAVLHGVATPGDRPFALLEEARSGLGVRHFALATPAAQADRILEAWRELEEDGPAAVSVHMLRPGRPDARCELALLSGVARLSRDGVGWDRSVPEDDWASLFQAAIPL